MIHRFFQDQPICRRFFESLDLMTRLNELHKPDRADVKNCLESVVHMALSEDIHEISNDLRTIDDLEGIDQILVGRFSFYYTKFKTDNCSQITFGYRVKNRTPPTLFF